jgi:hypothetical protein
MPKRGYVADFFFKKCVVGSIRLLVTLNYMMSILLVYFPIFELSYT